MPHPFTHYEQFRNASHSTTHVFGLGAESRVPGGTPKAQGEHTHGWGYPRDNPDLQTFPT